MTQISLICGTAGRIEELRRMLQSLVDQTFRDFQLILIDQNSDDRVSHLLQPFSPKLRVEHIKTIPGLCAALNLGLERAEGEIFGFPDDDCCYPPRLLQTVSELLQKHSNWDGLSFPTRDEHGKASIARWAKRGGKLTSANLGLRACSTSIFYRRSVCRKVGSFDENWGGKAGLLSPGSDIDYVHRVVRAGFHIQYDPRTCITHPQTLLILGDGEKGEKKRYMYGYGEGAIARKYSLPLWYIGALIGAPLLRAGIRWISGTQDKAHMEWITFQSRLDGWNGRLKSQDNGDISEVQTLSKDT